MSCTAYALASQRHGLWIDRDCVNTRTVVCVLRLLRLSEATPKFAVVLAKDLPFRAVHIGKRACERALASCEKELSVSGDVLRAVSHKPVESLSQCILLIPSISIHSETVCTRGVCSVLQHSTPGFEPVSCLDPKPGGCGSQRRLEADGPSPCCEVRPRGGGAAAL